MSIVLNADIFIALVMRIYKFKSFILLPKFYDVVPIEIGLNNTF